MILPTENCLEYQKWSPYIGRVAFSMPFVLKWREMAQPVPTKAFVQPAKVAPKCMAPRAENRPTLPIPPFC